MFKSKNKTPIVIMILVSLLTGGCPPQKGEIVCSYGITKAVKQTYATGVEGGKGELFTLQVKFECKDTAQLDSVYLRDKSIEFEMMRNGETISKINPKDSIQVIVNNFQLTENYNEATEQQASIKLYFSFGGNVLTDYIREFEKGEPLMNR